MDSTFVKYILPGNYAYQTTFDLTGLDPLTAVLGGSVAADNCLVDILLNGHATGIANSGAASGGGGGCINTANFQSFLAFTIGSSFAGDFVSGINTLTFIVANGAGGNSPAGVNVLISGTASPLAVPEPAALGLFGLALLGLGGIWLRRRT